MARIALLLTERVQRLGLVNSVIFEGWASEERVREFYAHADIFVLPSFAEGIPVVLMEAMATELPVISTWVNGVPELIENDRDGLLCAPGDSSGLAAAMDRLIRCPEVRTRLGTEGRRTVLEKYDLSRNVVAWADVLHCRVAIKDSSGVTVADAGSFDTGTTRSG